MSRAELSGPIGLSLNSRQTNSNNKDETRDMSHYAQAKQVRASTRQANYNNQLVFLVLLVILVCACQCE